MMLENTIIRSIFIRSKHKKNKFSIVGTKNDSYKDQDVSKNKRKANQFKGDESKSKKKSYEKNNFFCHRQRASVNLCRTQISMKVKRNSINMYSDHPYLNNKNYINRIKFQLRKMPSSKLQIKNKNEGSNSAISLNLHQRGQSQFQNETLRIFPSFDESAIKIMSMPIHKDTSILYKTASNSPKRTFVKRERSGTVYFANRTGIFWHKSRSSLVFNKRTTNNNKELYQSLLFDDFKDKNSDFTHKKIPFRIDVRNKKSVFSNIYMNFQAYKK